MDSLIKFCMCVRCRINERRPAIWDIIENSKDSVQFQVRSALHFAYSRILHCVWKMSKRPSGGGRGNHPFLAFRKYIEILYTPSNVHISMPMHNKYIVDDFPSPYIRLFSPSLHSSASALFQYMRGSVGGAVLAGPRETRGYYSGNAWWPNREPLPSM